MKLRELIEQLQKMESEHGGDVDVRLAHQPSWPFEYSISEVEAGVPGYDDEDEDEESPAKDDRETVIYIGEGRQLGYLPGSAARALGWK